MGQAAGALGIGGQSSGGSSSGYGQSGGPYGGNMVKKNNFLFSIRVWMNFGFVLVTKSL